VLLLFDIDGTLLLGASDQHRDSIHAALHEVHGLIDPASAHVAAPGRTDGDIARQILLRSGISAERIDERADAVRDVACREFAQRCPDDLREKVAPGMVELLTELDEMAAEQPYTTDTIDWVAERLGRPRQWVAEHLRDSSSGERRAG